MARATPSRRLVVDASVYRSAGPEDATFPLSKSCRDFLKAILRICHTVVFTDAIREEWRRHRSRFARTWLVQMYARKKVIELDVGADRALRAAIRNSSMTEKQKSAMDKDVHLLEAALMKRLQDTIKEGFVGANWQKGFCSSHTR